MIPGTLKWNQLVFLWPKEPVWGSLGMPRAILGTRGSCVAMVPASIRLCSFLPLEGGRVLIIRQCRECGCSWLWTAVWTVSDTRWRSPSVDPLLTRLRGIRVRLSQGNWLSNLLLVPTPSRKDFQKEEKVILLSFPENSGLLIFRVVY